MAQIKVCFYVFFPGGGIGRYTHELAYTLSTQEDLAVEVVCTPEYQWEGNGAYTNWRGLWSISHRLPLLRRTRFLVGQFVNPYRVIQHAFENRAGIIHFSNVNQLSFPLWKELLSRKKTPVAISVHDVRRQKQIVSKKWENNQLKEVYRYADALFVHSDYQAKELIEFAGIDRVKIQIVPHGPYSYGIPRRSRKEMRSLLGIPQDQMVGLFFGQIRDEKGLDQLLSSLAICERKPYLVVAGRGGGKHKDIDYYRERVKKLGITDYVAFVHQYIPDEDVADYFNMTDFTVLPYDASFTSHSGVLNISTQYFRPVLVGMAPVLREHVENFGVGVSCTDQSIESLSSSLEEISVRASTWDPQTFAAYNSKNTWQNNASLTRLKYLEVLKSQNGNTAHISY